MSVEIAFPVEFTVDGVPVSMQASAISREDWKSRVGNAAKETLPEGHWTTFEPVSVTIFYFPRTPMQGDLDNIAKPILDALKHVIYADDQQVERLVMQKFEPGRLTSFSNPTPVLASALEAEEPMVYIRIDDDVSQGR